jgi:hypothetical protein
MQSKLGYKNLKESSDYSLGTNFVMKLGVMIEVVPC